MDKTLETLTTQQIILISSISAAILLLLIIILVIVIKKRKPKVKKLKIDPTFIETLYKGLGGKENIKEVIVDNGRLKFNLINLKILDKASLDIVSQSGVFITGSFVKLLFKYDAKAIKNALEGK